MKLIEYLENKVRKFQTGGGILNWDMFKGVPETNSQITLPIKKFYLQHPSVEELNSFKNVFNIINKDPDGFFKLFRIKQILPISSVNGVIMVVETKTKKNIIDNELLVKVPQNITSDSVTYEYYVGQVLNELRIGRLSDNFALVYGLISCGFNTGIIDNLNKEKAESPLHNFPSLESIKILQTKNLLKKILPKQQFKLCDKKFPNKPHIIYEYIRNLDTNKTETFDKYIDRLTGKLTESQRDEIELNIINLTIMIMYSLQVAQDYFNFTHYDLHTGNILIIELGKPEPVNIIYRGKQITIMTNVIPHIIDYGRGYVNPIIAQNIINKKTYYDIQQEILGEKYNFSSFQSYQKELFQNKNYVYDIEDKLKYDSDLFDIIDEIFLREDSNELLYSKNLNKFFIIKTDKRSKYTMIDNTRYDIINGYISYKNKAILLEQMDRNSFVKWISNNIYHKNIQGMKDLIIEQRGNLLINKYDGGVHSDKPNTRYDMFRLCKLICSKVRYISTQLIESNISLKHDGVWSNLNKQLDLEYPFCNNNAYLPSDYHVTDFFAIGFKTYIKEPKNVAEYLADNIRSTFPTDIMDIDPQHVFQIVSEE